ncbi:MAG: serine/threonine protein kinase [Planctomycetes bacterium]|nr:serine/threonine protein kinase [Planctomycetota bacterium]
MNDKAANSSPGATGESPPERFGFGLPDQEWLDQLRRAVAPRTGLRIGQFELLGEIRRGAQGVVVRARQPHTQRTIALKRLAHGSWSTPQERFRFDREVEAAVALSHPNIVAVYGVEQVDGQPLLAMEWVEGKPIDQWARRGREGEPRPKAVLLDAFLRVCDAVHHAHQRGVIHRDLKSGNILMSAEPTPQPKVLDFGLAKRFDSTAPSARLTASGDFLGTPAYAAPEQLTTPSAVDVRTDVYALGVILFELLTGRLPFVADQGVATLFDQIRQAQPPPPSRIAALADGDLDAIVLKAMAREPQRRYPSVDALAADLRRYLAREPIEARRGQRWYALRKALRRYWIGMTIVGAFVLLAGAAALALSLMYAQQGRVLEEVAAARDAESVARHDAERILATLEQLLVQLAEAGRGTDLALRRDLLGEAEQMIEKELRDAPRERARAFETLGRTYQQLALYADSERCLRAALDLNVGLAGPDSLDAARSMNRLAELCQDCSRYADAEPLFRKVLELRARLLGPQHRDVAESLHNLGNVLSDREEFGEALKTYQRAYAMRCRLLGEKDPESISSLTAVGLAHGALDNVDEAERCLRQALALSIEARGPAHRDTAGLHVGLGKVLQTEGRLDEAEEHLRTGLSLFRNLLGDRHDNVAWAAHRLGTLLQLRGRFEEAETLLCEARDTYRTVLGPDDPFVGFVCESLAELLHAAGRDDEADQAAAEAERIRAIANARRGDR